MKSVRLNGINREIILSNLILDRFGPAYEQFDKDKISLALDGYNTFFGAAMIRKMKRLPDGWLPTYAGSRFYFGSRSTYLDFCCNVANPHAKGYIRLPFPHHVKGIKFPVNSPLTTRFEEIERLQQAKSEKRNSASAQAWSVLRQATTLRKLLEIWPEISKFVPASMYEEEILPALPIQSLNKTFGL